MNLDKYDHWLISHDNKTKGSAYSYKIAIPKIEKHYSAIKQTPVDFFKITRQELKSIAALYGKNGDEFSFGDKSNGTYRNALNALLRFRVSNENLEPHFTWVKTHLELAKYLRNFNNKQIELIDLLKSAGVTGFSDKDLNNKNIDLQEIDPFTFFCYIYKYGDQRRLEILQSIATLLHLHHPDDERGIPSSNAQKVWLFPYKEARTNNEIERLWSFFYSVLDDDINNESFADLLDIKGVAKTKLTEALFNVNPEKYFPINAPTKSYLKEVFGINPQFETFGDYKQILNQIQSKSDKPFYQLSYDAWLWNEANKNNKASSFINYLNHFSNDDLKIYFTFLFDAVDKFNLKEGDERIFYSTTDNNLAFTIGQRFSWCLFKSNKKGKFGVLSKDKIRPRSEEFTGNAPYPYYTYFDEINFSKIDEESIFNGFERELVRTNKTSYKKHNNQDFEHAVFDKFFRERYAKTEIMEDKKTPINQIIYGPPGTGKTFYLKNKLFEKYTVKETSISQEKYFEERVATLTWWQVIALALIEIGTARVNNILENRWVSKKARLSESKNVRATLWGTLQMHTVIESKNVAYTQRQTPFIFDKNEDKSWRLLEVELKEQVPELYDILDAVNNFKANPDKVIKHYDFITFHQSFAYEDFMEGIKPMIPDSETELAETKELGYVIKDGVFKNICKKAQNDPANRYAIFIDEINRGNVSAIFGELITLIETDKRKGAKNEMSTTLPYSKTSFSVPSNLDIYGTMNTADRSVEALDTALRRRFEFKAMMPDYAVIADEIVAGISLAKVLETINKRIELLIDKDHTIGHSYFIAINSEKKLARAFKNKIVPLLQEYFYGDYGKIGLVLGKGFVEKVKNNNSEFANFEYENANDFKNDTYNLITIDSTNILEAIGLLVAKKEQN
jgi:hypothetical protein